MCSFHGALIPTDVARIVGNSHLYIHTAVTMKYGQAESFGISILEAIAMGKPAIYFDSGGISEVFSDVKSIYYISVKEKNVSELVNAINKMLPVLIQLDESHFECIRNDIVAKFSEDRFMASIYSLYERVITAHKLAINRNQ